MSLWNRSIGKGAYCLGGELGQELVPLFVEHLSFIGGGDVRLDLAELDIEDGVAAAAAVDALRQLARRCTSLTLVHAPQVLAHILYRSGLLSAKGMIILDSPREELPYD